MRSGSETAFDLPTVRTFKLHWARFRRQAQLKDRCSSFSFGTCGSCRGLPSFWPSTRRNRSKRRVGWWLAPNPPKKDSAVQKQDRPARVLLIFFGAGHWHEGWLLAPSYPRVLKPSCNAPIAKKWWVNIREWPKARIAH